MQYQKTLNINAEPSCRSQSKRATAINKYNVQTYLPVFEGGGSEEQNNRKSGQKNLICRHLEDSSLSLEEVFGFSTEREVGNTIADAATTLS